MSGGEFEYLQRRYEWGDAIEKISKHIQNNPDEYNEKTLLEFEEGLFIIQLARIYLERIDYLLSGDDGEDSFHTRLSEDIDMMVKEIDDSETVDVPKSLTGYSCPKCGTVSSEESLLSDTEPVFHEQPDPHYTWT